METKRVNFGKLHVASKPMLLQMFHLNHSLLSQILSQMIQAIQDRWRQLPIKDSPGRKIPQGKPATLYEESQVVWRMKKSGLANQYRARYPLTPPLGAAPLEDTMIPQAPDLAHCDSDMTMPANHASPINLHLFQIQEYVTAILLGAMRVLNQHLTMDRVATWPLRPRLASLQIWPGVRTSRSTSTQPQIRAGLPEKVRK